MRQVFVGWACCRVLVRCGGFFIGWIVAGFVYLIDKAYDTEKNQEQPVTTMFFIIHMILYLFFLSQKFRWFEAALGKDRIRDTGEGDPHMYVTYSILVAWIVISNGWYGHDSGEYK